MPQQLVSVETDPRDRCPAAGQVAEWQPSVFHGKVCQVCPECGWLNHQERLGAPELPEHRRADQCEIHGVYLSNGAGTQCDWCREEDEAEEYGVFEGHCPGCGHWVELVGLEPCPHCGWTQGQ